MVMNGLGCETNLVQVNCSIIDLNKTMRQQQRKNERKKVNQPKIYKGRIFFPIFQLIYD